MILDINTITTPFIFRITVNCYLIRTEGGFILVDTAKTGKRSVVERELNSAGCCAGYLTHPPGSHVLI
jgi:flavorubredoxin